MGTFRKLNRIFDKSTKIKLFILLVCIIVNGLIETATVALAFPVIDLLVDNTAVDTNSYIRWIQSFFGFDGHNSLLAFLTFSMAAVYIFRGLYHFIFERIKIRFIARKQASCSKQLLNKIIKFSYLYHTHKNIAELQRIINDDVSEMFHMVSGILLFLADFFMTFFMMAFLFYTSPVMTLCVLGLALICVAVYFLLFRKSIRKAGKTNRKAKIKMGKSVYQIFGGIKEIKVSRRENYFEKIYNDARDRYVKTFTKYKVLDILPKIALEMICFGGAFTLMGFTVLAGTNMTSIVPQLALFVLAAFRILPAITAQIKGINAILYNRASVDAVYNSLYEEKDISAQVNPSLLSSASNKDSRYAENSNQGIEVCNVSFSYPKTGQSVLRDISFTVPENKSVALVGPSGVGKTTLADLILGVLTPDAGTILYKGKPIYGSNHWSNSIGYIPQHIYLLDESVLENVAFGIDEKDINEEKVWRALEQAQLKEFVQTLPEGINTVIGERGIRLSGGQRQRIGIARAIYEDPPVLVLDEATSSLDNETEQAVMDAIMGFQGNKTILIIAHRLSTIEHCDIVYKVEDKNIMCERRDTH